MKKTRHTYHYTVRRLKRNKTQAIKLKLAEKSNDSASFCQEIKKLNPNNSPDIVDNANTDEDITNVFKENIKNFIQVCQLIIWSLKQSARILII